MRTAIQDDDDDDLRIRVEALEARTELLFTRLAEPRPATTHGNDDLRNLITKLVDTQLAFAHEQMLVNRRLDRLRKNLNDHLPAGHTTIDEDARAAVEHISVRVDNLDGRLRRRAEALHGVEQRATRRLNRQSKRLDRQSKRIRALLDNIASLEQSLAIHVDQPHQGGTA